jgi:hypothetical protein
VSNVMRAASTDPWPSCTRAFPCCGKNSESDSPSRKNNPLAAFGPKTYWPRGGFSYSARLKATGPGRGARTDGARSPGNAPKDSGPAFMSGEGNQSPAQRKPILLFWFVGLLLFRFETRKLFVLLFQLPPRKTRYVIGRPPQSRIQTKAAFTLEGCSCRHRPHETATRSPKPRSISQE